MQMEGMPHLAINTSFGDKDIACLLNRPVKFSVMLQNLGSEPIKKIKVMVNIPQPVKIPVKVKSIGFFAAAKSKELIFKMKSNISGDFDGEIIVKVRDAIVNTIPFRLRVAISHMGHQTPQPMVQTPQPRAQTSQSRVQTSVYSNSPNSAASPRQDINDINGPMIICPNCNAKLKETSKFCTKCGYDLSIKIEDTEESNICTECGASMEKEAIFCSECGKEL